MTEPTSEVSTIKAIEKLLAYYNFQDEAQTREQLLDRWLRSYPIDWVRSALIEALYQGRYKSASVEYLLQLWKRRGQSLHRFSREFERLVSHNCPQTFLSLLQVPTSVQEPRNSHKFLSTFMDEILAVSEEPPLREQTSPIRPEPLEQEDAQEAAIKGADPFPADVAQPDADERLLEPAARTKEEAPEGWLAHAIDRSDICRTVGRISAAADPIHCFTPISRPSELYTKLAAIANAE
ncbi:hypothetical protein C1752_01061 [Acaryochloris thomasi RCC1774]|uniref:Uncharacterized protein n=1 Tax=Acaryochloris thomasi RCC1774 TaxID=1764569 RepID=A0A2W1K3T1_9CYAN|nr:hypothetical protein [Acaryochloris thomasi]PZD74741.1 hypothetical protein C1752_01061 [Acaryochloris thomasi RCC1774]